MMLILIVLKISKIFLKIIYTTLRILIRQFVRVNAKTQAFDKLMRICPYSITFNAFMCVILCLIVQSSKLPLAGTTFMYFKFKLEVCRKNAGSVKQKKIKIKISTLQVGANDENNKDSKLVNITWKWPIFKRGLYRHVFS